MTFFSPLMQSFESAALLRKVTNHFSHLGGMRTVFFPPLVPLKPAQQLFTGEAAGSKPMRGFMQIECARYFHESCLPARKFELVDPQ